MYSIGCCCPYRLYKRLFLSKFIFVQDLNLSNGSVMTLTTEERGETDCTAGGAPTAVVRGSEDESEDEDQPRNQGTKHKFGTVSFNCKRR